MKAIKVDFDEPLTRESLAQFERRRELVSDVLSIPIELSQVWRTRRGSHVVCFTSRDLSPIEIVMLQLLLGSDWKREMFNYARVLVLADVPEFWRSDDRWNVLYSEKDLGEPTV